MGEVRAIAYLRESTGKQKVSAETQLGAIRLLCAERGWTLGEIFHDEAVTSAIPLCDRKVGKTMLEFIGQRKADKVLFYRLDRGFRDNIEPIQFWRQIKRSKCEPVFMDMLSMEGMDPDTAEIMVFFQGFRAKGERMAIKARTRDALQGRKRRGVVYSKNAPYGWEKVDGLLAESDQEQTAVRLIRQWYEAGMGTTSIGKLLLEQAPPLLPRTGGTWSNKILLSILREQGVEIRAYKGAAKKRED